MNKLLVKIMYGNSAQFFKDILPLFDIETNNTQTQLVGKNTKIELFLAVLDFLRKTSLNCS